MKAELLEQVTKKIMDRYNENPEGWRILTDKKGNVLVLGPRIGYRLKLIAINPKEYTGVGLRIANLEETRSIAEGTPSYGFRPLSGEEARALFHAILHKSASQDELIKRLLAMKPVPTWELQERRPEAIVSGPIIVHPNLSTISKRQRELEARLALEAEELFRKRYPSRARIYY